MSQEPPPPRPGRSSAFAWTGDFTFGDYSFQNPLASLATRGGKTGRRDPEKSHSAHAFESCFDARGHRGLFT